MGSTRLVVQEAQNMRKAWETTQGPSNHGQPPWLINDICHAKAMNMQRTMDNQRNS